jgi:hypothetical protein
MTEYFGEFEPAQLRYVQQPFDYTRDDSSEEDGSDSDTRMILEEMCIEPVDIAQYDAIPEEAYVIADDYRTILLNMSNILMAEPDLLVYFQKKLTEMSTNLDVEVRRSDEIRKKAKSMSISCKRRRKAIEICDAVSGMLGASIRVSMQDFIIQCRDKCSNEQEYEDVVNVLVKKQPGAQEIVSILSGETDMRGGGTYNSGMSGGGWFKRTYGEAPWTGTKAAHTNAVASRTMTAALIVLGVGLGVGLGATLPISGPIIVGISTAIGGVMLISAASQFVWGVLQEKYDDVHKDRRVAAELNGNDKGYTMVDGKKVYPLGDNDVLTDVTYAALDGIKQGGRLAKAIYDVIAGVGGDGDHQNDRPINRINLQNMATRIGSEQIMSRSNKQEKVIFKTSEEEDEDFIEAEQEQELETDDADDADGQLLREEAGFGIMDVFDAGHEAVQTMVADVKAMPKTAIDKLHTKAKVLVGDVAAASTLPELVPDDLMELAMMVLELRRKKSKQADKKFRGGGWNPATWFKKETVAAPIDDSVQNSGLSSETVTPDDVSESESDTDIVASEVFASPIHKKNPEDTREVRFRPFTVAKTLVPSEKGNKSHVYDKTLVQKLNDEPNYKQDYDEYRSVVHMGLPLVHEELVRRNGYAHRLYHPSDKRITSRHRFVDPNRMTSEPAYRKPDFNKEIDKDIVWADDVFGGYSTSVPVAGVLVSVTMVLAFLGGV